MGIWAGARRQRTLKVMVRILYLLFLKKKKKKNYLFYFCLCWVFVAGRLSLVAASWDGGGYSSLQCMGFSLQGLLLLWSTGSRGAGSVVEVHELSSSNTGSFWKIWLIKRGK